MDYVIKNNRGVYIKLNDNGSPVSCAQNEKTLFEYSKAKNVCDNLPKSLRMFHFKVEAIPDIACKQEEDEKIIQSGVIDGEDYTIPDSVSRWVDKFGVCDDLINEARKRKDELIISLSNVDKDFSNIIHKIELERPKDLYRGWLLYKEIKSNRKKRRDIKDELLIITSVMKMNFKNFDSQNIRKTVNGLANRKFALRIVEEDDEDVLQ